MSKSLHSIGHSSLPIAEFIKKLKASRIERLVDVRTKPRSRFSPQYNQFALIGYLAEAGIIYDFRGKNLGGLGENILYVETLNELVELSQNERIAIMCSELKYEACHRYLTLTPDLERLGVKVIHIS